jgi:tRNA threonylcarbamoyladenosine modification (KEOPS) complex Cgi121 subunit
VVALQLFDSDTIATHLHVLVSALYALRAFHIGKSISNSLGTEVLLYASAQHQIVDAINRIGLKPESLGVAAVAISLSEDAASQALAVAMKELAGQMDDNVLNIRSVRKERAIKTVFGITEEELNATGMGTDLKDVERAITRRVLSRISIMAVSK